MPIIYWGLVIKKFLLVFLLPLAALSALDKDPKAKEPVTYETDVDFRGFSWGTSMDDVIKKMGKPISREKVNGLDSLLWESIDVNGYATYMIAYFSKSRLQGGTYYFVTKNIDDEIACYSKLRQQLLDRFGPTRLYDIMIREMRPYESAWELPGGYVYLMVNPRLGDPITLWYSSPELSKQVFGNKDPVTAKK
jgi:hypothetical protein